MTGKNSKYAGSSGNITQEKICATKTKLTYQLDYSKRINKTTNRVILMSDKGGMGKTVLSVLFSLEAEKEGLNVLLIDAGQTPFASMSLFNDFEKYDKFYFDKSKRFDEVIRIDDFLENTKFNNLDVLPLGIYTELFSFQMLYKKIQLIKKLNEIILRYDLVFIDIDRTFSETKFLSLILSDFALIPIQPGSLEIKGLRRVFYSIKKANQEKELLIETGKFSKIQVAGILLNKFRITSQSERMYARILQRRFPKLLMKNYLCIDSKYSNLFGDNSKIPKNDSIMAFQITQAYRELMSNIQYANLKSFTK
ncbi:ParA family protein [Leptospira kmetyi]|uniref:ParA family protein n=1 Tax=Leptospira kmetyi TaxID=408139 RepID=UPI0010841058|nr:ParA family protein [Leptospira kmetyi]TGK34429.1 ParA family protein [Leptospira kmetyi]